MSKDPVVRLAALHSSSFIDALELLMPDEIPASKEVADSIEDAILSFTETIEDAICRGLGELELDLQTAELLSLELKRRKRKRGRPKQTGRENTLRTATLIFAQKKFQVLRGEGCRPSEALSRAAEEASARSIQAGDYVSPSTIERLLKEAAAEKKTKNK